MSGFTYTIVNNVITGATGSGEAIIPDSVTAINQAVQIFISNTSLTKLTVSTNSLLNTIQGSSFSGCTNLTEITLGSTSLKRLEGSVFRTTKISSIVIPSGITYIGGYCFNNCYYLSSVTLPSTLIDLQDNVFNGCSLITNVALPTSLSSINNYCFLNTSITSVVYPDSMRYLGFAIFGDTTAVCKIKDITFNPTYVAQPLGSYVPQPVRQNVTSMTISPNAVYIIENAFEYYGISSIIIPTGLTGMGQFAFQNCASLTSVSFPSTLAYVSNYSFRYCTSLTSVTFPSTMKNIGYSAFYDTGLRSVNIPDTVTTVGGFAFSTISLTSFAFNSSVITNPNSTFSYTNVTSVTLSPTSTGLQNFWGLPLVQTINIPNSIVSAGDQVLMNCASLTSITFDYYNSTFTGYPSFFASNCPLLKSMIIPKSAINYPRTYAFSSCPNLTDIVLNTNIYLVTAQLPTSFTNVTIMPDSYVLSTIVFNGWNKMKYINLPSSVTSIYDGAFGYCTSLTSITSSSIIDIRESAFAGCTALTSVSFSSLKRIYPSTFYNCSALQSFTFPNSTTQVESNSFTGCTSLSSVTMNSGLYLGDSLKPQFTSVTITPESTRVIGAFMRTASLITSIQIPPNVTYIGYEAFRGCTNLASVDLSGNNSLRYIESYAFLNCPSLHDFNLPDSVTSLEFQGALAFAGTTRLQHITFKPNTILNFYNFIYLTGVTIHPDTTFLSVAQFNLCSSLTSVTIPNGVTAIPDYCFVRCSSLSSITIPSNVRRMGRESINLAGITSITIPSSVTFLDINAITSCVNLKDITVLGSGVTISSGAFAGNNSMTSLTLNSATISANFVQTSNYQGSVTNLVINGTCTFDAYAFLYGGSNLKNLTYNSSLMNFSDIRIIANNITSCTLLPGSTVIPSLPNLKNISMPETVTSISNTLFQGNTALTSVNIPAAVTSIDTNTFKNCSSLRSIIIPNTVFSLGSSAFQGCSSLTEISLPNTLTQLTSGVFQSCTSLKTAIIPNSITLLNSNSFNGCSAMTYVTINSRKIKIGSYAFANCPKLARVDIQENLSMLSAFSSTFASSEMNLRLIGTTDPPTFIADNAFLNDISLNFFSIPITTTSIGMHAFDGCISLRDIVIPVNVQYVYEYAFRGCTSMTDVLLNANRMYTQLSTNSFQNTPLIPKSTKDVLLTKGYSAAYLMNAGFVNVRPLPCFKEDTKILCFVDGEEKEMFVQDIRKGVLVKTRLHGYVPVDMIGKSKMYNPNNQERYTDRLYLCSRENYPDLNEDLVITGCHAILVDDFKEGQREKTVDKFGRVFVTDKKYRLIAEFDDRAIAYKYEGTFNIYHLALENESYYANYGIFANGLLVESCSKRYLKELSKMTLL